MVYVDDVIITGSSSFLMKSLIQKLDKTFVLKDLGRLHYFLGIQIHYLESGFILNQAKYVDDLLHKLKLSDVKPIASPSVQGKLLSKTDGNPLDDLFIYRSIIGTLQYLTHTRPDIAYIVNHLSQFLQCPTDVHWQAVKRVLQYISGTKHFGVLSIESYFASFYLLRC